MTHAENPNDFRAPGISSSEPRSESVPGVEGRENPGETLTEQQILRVVDALGHFLRQQRSRYYPLGEPLSPKTKAFLARFFDPSLLGQVKILKMSGERVPNPPFFEMAKRIGLKNLPDLKHQSTVTFLDVVVFNEPDTERALFHGLVHATQVQILGIERFAELLIRGFLCTKSFFMIPLKAHAFALDCQFAEHPERGFSVETEVTRWMEQGRY